MYVNLSGSVHFQTVAIFSATNHSILFSDPGNESEGSCGSNAPLDSKIAQLVADIFHKTFRSHRQKSGPKWSKSKENRALLCLLWTFSFKRSFEG